MIFNMIASGGSDWELLAEAHLGELNITDTTAVDITPVEDLIVPSKVIDNEKYLPLLVICVVDANGSRTDHFLASASYVTFTRQGTTYRNYNNSVTLQNTLYNSGGTILQFPSKMGSGYGVFAYSMTDGKVAWRSRYNGGYTKTIDGDFYAYAYALKTPINILGE